MKIKIHIDRAAAIAAGNEAYGPQIVDVPLEFIAPDLRAELATLTEQDGVTDASASSVDGESRSDDPRIDLDRASPDAVVAVLRHRLAVRAFRADAGRRADEELIVRALAAPLAEWFGFSAQARAYYEVDDAGTLSRDATGYSRREPTLVRWPLYVTAEQAERCGADPRVIARRAEAEAALPAARAAWQEKYDTWRAGVAEREARKQAGLDALRAWAETAGSERVRQMLALGVGDWQAVASREFTDTHAPVGYTHGCRDGEARRKPTLPELQEIERLRNLCAASGGVLSDPELRWVVEEAECSEETGEETPERRYCVAVVRVTDPTGDSACYDSEIPA